MAILDYSRLNKNPNARIIVSGLADTVVGFVSSNLSIGAGNQFGTPLQNAAQQALSETLGATQAVAAGWAEKFGFKGLSKPITLNTVQQSVKTWTGSDLPVFNVVLKFIAVNEDDDVREGVAMLLSAVTPNFLNIVDLSTTITPPLGYLPKPPGKSASGTITVSVGNWFRAPLQVMTNVSFDFSKEVVPNGSPVYAEGTISFTPFRVISATEIASYLRQ